VACGTAQTGHCSLGRPSLALFFNGGKVAGAKVAITAREERQAVVVRRGLLKWRAGKGLENSSRWLMALFSFGKRNMSSFAPRLYTGAWATPHQYLSSVKGGAMSQLYR